MPTYPVTTPQNGINQGLFPSKVNSEFFKEWVQITPFFNLMGNEMTRPIVRHQMKAGEGWNYAVPKLNSLDYKNPVIDFNQVSGAGQTQKVDADNVTCQGLSFPVTIKGRELLRLGTPIDLPSSVRPQLIETCQRNLNKMLLDAATTSNYAVATQKPSYDRIVLAGNAVTRTNYNSATGLTAALDLITDDVGFDEAGLSATHLRKLKRYAVQGGADTGKEDAIRPAFMKTRSGWPVNDYIYLCDTASLEQLYLDPAFSQSTVSRGTVIDADQPQTINGADYHGKFMGIHIYEVKDLADYQQTSGDKKFSWNLLIGAGAWTLGWFEEPNIAFKHDVINRVEEYTTHEIRGQKALKFAAKTPVTGVSTVEQGIIHSFVRIL